MLTQQIHMTIMKRTGYVRILAKYREYISTTDEGQKQYLARLNLLKTLAI